MGDTLEKPITDKKSLDEENTNIQYGMSEVQGWKNQMEIYTFKETNIGPKNNFNIFGLFEGHNGVEIAKYLSLNFYKILSQNKNFLEGNYNQSLKETFLNIDDSFRTEEIKSELKKLSNNPVIINNNIEEKEKISNFLEIFNPRSLQNINIAEFVGSSGIVILLTDTIAYIANVGNSKCIPINKNGEIIKDKINKEHMIYEESEIKRLKIAYGFMEENDEKFQIENFHPLMITRSFGDLQYKNNKLLRKEDQFISIEPEILEININELWYLIIGNYSFFNINQKNRRSVIQKTSENMLNKINSDANKKLSKVIEEVFDELLSEDEKKYQNGQIEFYNKSCILIKFKNTGE